MRATIMPIVGDTFENSSIKPCTELSFPSMLNQSMTLASMNPMHRPYTRLSTVIGDCMNPRSKTKSTVSPRPPKTLLNRMTIVMRRKSHQLPRIKLAGPLITSA